MIIFDDFQYLISTPAAGRSASFISKSFRTAMWHILVMEVCSRQLPVGILQPASFSRSYLLSPTNTLSLSCLLRVFRPAEHFAPLRQQHFSGEVADSAVTQYLTVTMAGNNFPLPHRPPSPSLPPSLSLPLSPSLSLCPSSLSLSLSLSTVVLVQGGVPHNRR